MLSLNDIIKITQKYSVLYVEDEKTIREEMVSILGFFFDDIGVAVDGADGLVKFSENSYDIVITDIQMPKINGLELIKEIREYDKEIPIIVTTAFNDQNYFLKSIELKVDKYLIKPIEQENVKDTLYRVAKALSNKEKAKELQQIKIKEEINKTSEYITNQIIESYQNPCIILQDNIAKYVNIPFCDFFDENEVVKIVSDTILNKQIFDNRDGFLKSLSQYNEKNPAKNIVSISKKDGKKIYRVEKQNINLEKNLNTYIYIFYKI